RDQVAPFEPAWLDGLQLRPAAHYHTVHPRTRRHDPVSAEMDVRGEVRRGEEALRQHPVRWQRLEPRLRRAREWGLREIGELICAVGRLRGGDIAHTRRES